MQRIRKSVSPIFSKYNTAVVLNLSNSSLVMFIRQNSDRLLEIDLFWLLI